MLANADNPKAMSAYAKTQAKAGKSRAEFIAESTKDLMEAEAENAAFSDKPVRSAKEISEEFGSLYDEANGVSARAPEAKDEKPPMPGARKAKDGNWYVQKDGKNFKVGI